MSVTHDFNKVFGNKKTTTAPTTDRPKAAYWLNIGYETDVVDEAGEHKFVSLPMGIPVDTQETLSTNSRSPEFAAFQSARNDLVDQIMALAGQLEAGESRILNLQIQLRRVNEEAAPIANANNPFVRKLDL